MKHILVQNGSNFFIHVNSLDRLLWLIIFIVSLKEEGPMLSIWISVFLLQMYLNRNFIAEQLFQKHAVVLWTGPVCWQGHKIDAKFRQDKVQENIHR